VVIEMDPALKRDLHVALAAEGLTLKDWFLREAEAYLVRRAQPELPGVESRVTGALSRVTYAFPAPAQRLRVAEEPPRGSPTGSLPTSS
jgi:hypothetical protein